MDPLHHMRIDDCVEKHDDTETSSIIQPMVSVVVMAYNEEKYIEKSIRSIIEQGTRITYEVLISDDASQDRTADIIQSFQKKYPNIIKLFMHDNNVGIPIVCYEIWKECRGKYTMFLDGDDYWLPGKLERQVEYMENHPETGVVCEQVRVLYDRCNKFASMPTKYYETDFQGLIEHNNINSMTACIRTELLRDYLQEIVPEEKDWLMEDYPLWLWVAKNSKITALSEIGAVYRQRFESVSHPKQLERNLCFTKNTYEIAVFFADTEETREMAKRVYDYAIAENHWLFGDMRGFRKSYREGLNNHARVLDLLKVLLSYIPGMGIYLRNHYCKER